MGYPFHPLKSAEDHIEDNHGICLLIQLERVSVSIFANFKRTSLFVIIKHRSMSELSFPKPFKEDPTTYNPHTESYPLISRTTVTLLGNTGLIA